MTFEITPEPDEQERRAILAALAQEQAERPADAPWAEAARPARSGEDEADP